MNIGNTFSRRLLFARACDDNTHLRTIFTNIDAITLYNSLHRIFECIYLKKQAREFIVFHLLLCFNMKNLSVRGTCMRSF